MIASYLIGDINYKLNNNVLLFFFCCLLKSHFATAFMPWVLALLNFFIGTLVPCETIGGLKSQLNPLIRSSPRSKERGNIK